MPTDTAKGLVRFWDDFIGDTLDTFLWTANADTGGTATIIEAPGGELRLTTDGTNGDIQSIFGPEIFQADDGGPLVFEARVRLVTSATQGVFIGLTDDNDADEVPIDLDTGTLTTTATDAVGFVYDSQETPAVWYAVGVKADADTAQTTCRVNGLPQRPTVGTYQTFRIQVTPEGHARFFINEAECAYIQNCVTPTVSLCPAVAQLASGTAATVSVDYVGVEAARVA